MDNTKKSMDLCIYRIGNNSRIYLGIFERETDPQRLICPAKINVVEYCFSKENIEKRK